VRQSKVYKDYILCYVSDCLPGYLLCSLYIKQTSDRQTKAREIALDAFTELQVTSSEGAPYSSTATRPSSAKV